MTGPGRVLAAAGRRGPGLARGVGVARLAGALPRQSSVAMEGRRSGQAGEALCGRWSGVSGRSAGGVGR